jgi:hypothetical protein
LLEGRSRVGRREGAGRGERDGKERVQEGKAMPPRSRRRRRRRPTPASSEGGPPTLPRAPAPGPRQGLPRHCPGTLPRAPGSVSTQAGRLSQHDLDRSGLDHCCAGPGGVVVVEDGGGGPGGGPGRVAKRPLAVPPQQPRSLPPVLNCLIPPRGCICLLVPFDRQSGRGRVGREQAPPGDW